MQTFLPYADFAQSASVLDRQRLGKQRVETLQVAKAIVTGSGWVNHPVTKMWSNHLGALVTYQRAICFEWTNNRGYKDTCLEKTIAIAETLGDSDFPDFIGDESFHASHRSNLLRKDAHHYGQFGWTERDDLEYVWPI